MMKILLITNKGDITTDFVVKSLTEQKALFYRLNTDEISKSVSIVFNFKKNDYYIYDNLLNLKINLLNIKSVYFRRPELDIDRNNLTEGEFNFIRSEIYYTLEGLYKILDKAYWVNSVYNIRNAENKIYQLLLAQKIGFSIPKSLITNVPTEAMKFYNQENQTCIIKPIKTGLVEGKNEEGVIFTNEIKLTENNSKRISSCPSYLQGLIKKKGDLRVTVVGDKLFAAFIDSQKGDTSKIDWRKTTKPLAHKKYELSKKVSLKCLDLLKKLKLNFGALDFIVTEKNKLIFLEINPNGQWAWIEKKLNYPISKQLSKLLIEKGA